MNFVTALGILKCWLTFPCLVYGVELIIHTNNSGNVQGITHTNFFQYYTNLYDYGITLNQKQSQAFEILASNDAFFLLSASRDLNSTIFYEIVIGSNANWRIKIYRVLRPPLLLLYKKNILSRREFRRFVVSWYLNGSIILHTPYGSVNATDDQPFLVEGLGIKTGYGANGTWKFNLKDCENHTYGYFCEHICGQCQGTDVCDRFNGSCLNGCKENWKGEKCNKLEEPMCPCSCEFKNNTEYRPSNPQTYLPREELMASLQPKLDLMKKELSINQSNLSSIKRRQTSAPDNRTSSKCIGMVAITILVIVPGLIIWSDIATFINR